MKTAPFHFPALARLRLVALMAVREALHLRIVTLFVVVALLPLAAVGWLREFNFGTAEWKFIVDFGHGALGAGGLVLAVLATVQLTFSDLENGSAPMLLTRALTPTEFLLGKYAGMLALLAWFATGLGAVLLGVLWWRTGVHGFPLAAVLGGIALIWLKLAVTVALTLVVCSYARSALFAMGVALLLVVAAHLRPIVGPGFGWTQVLVQVLPNFQLFSPERFMDATPAARPMLAAGSAIYALAYGALYSTVAAWFLRRREY